MPTPTCPICHKTIRTNIVLLKEPMSVKSLPQSERSQNLKELLAWIKAKSMRKGATTQQILERITIEITDLGATTRTARSYLVTLERAGLIYTQGLRWKITDKGKNWLERKYLL